MTDSIEVTTVLVPNISVTVGIMNRISAKAWSQCESSCVWPRMLSPKLFQKLLRCTDSFLDLLPSPYPFITTLLNFKYNSLGTKKWKDLRNRQGRISRLDVLSTIQCIILEINLRTWMCSSLAPRGFQSFVSTDSRLPSQPDLQAYPAVSQWSGTPGEVNETLHLWFWKIPGFPHWYLPNEQWFLRAIALVCVLYFFTFKI